MCRYLKRRPLACQQLCVFFVSAICWLEFSYFTKCVRIFDIFLRTRHFTADCFSNHMKPKKKKRTKGNGLRLTRLDTSIFQHPLLHVQPAISFHSKMHQHTGGCIIVKCHFVWHFHFIYRKKVGTSPYQKKKSLTMKIFMSSNRDSVNNGLCLQGAHLLSTVNLIYPRFLIFHSLCGPLSQFSFQSWADNETWVGFCIDDH